MKPPKKNKLPPVLHTQTAFDIFILEACNDTLPSPVQPRPRWKDYCNAALRRILRGVGLHSDRATHGRQIAEEIVAAGDGAAFLKAARRGRGTAKQNVRVELIREVERLVDVERRRPCANIREAKPGELFAPV